MLRLLVVRCDRWIYERAPPIFISCCVTPKYLKANLHNIETADPLISTAAMPRLSVSCCWLEKSKITLYRVLRALFVRLAGLLWIFLWILSTM